MVNRAKVGFTNRIFILAWLPLISGCAGQFSRFHHVDSALNPESAERSLIRGFIQLEIPLQERTINGRVSSGRFSPVEVWGTRTTERVVCGSPAETDPRLYPDPSEFEIVATIQKRNEGGTRIDLDAFGWAETTDKERVPCRPTKAFVDQIFSKVSRETWW